MTCLEHFSVILSVLCGRFFGEFFDGNLTLQFAWPPWSNFLNDAKVRFASLYTPTEFHSSFINPTS